MKKIKVKDSIWEQNEEGKWNLYFNIEEKQEKEDFSSIRIKNPDTLKLGTLVMSPNGMGRLIKIEQNFGYIKQKEDPIEKKYSLEKLSTNFYCFIYFLKKPIEENIRLKLKVSGKIEDIFIKLENIKKINYSSINNNDSNIKYILFTKGIKISSDNDNKKITFEQLNLQNNSKFIFTEEIDNKYKISRFTEISESGRSLSIDEISFSVSQKIRLRGIGIFSSNEGKTLNSCIEIFEGNNFDEQSSIYDQRFDIPPASSKLNPVFHVNFYRPINLKENQDYVIILITKNSWESCYLGEKEQNVIEGEKGVKFSFNQALHFFRINSYRTRNFPEFYYDIN